MANARFPLVEFADYRSALDLLVDSEAGAVLKRWDLLGKLIPYAETNLSDDDYQKLRPEFAVALDALVEELTTGSFAYDIEDFLQALEKRRARRAKRGHSSS